MNQLRSNISSRHLSREKMVAPIWVKIHSFGGETGVTSLGRIIWRLRFSNYMPRALNRTDKIYRASLAVEFSQR